MSRNIKYISLPAGRQGFTLLELLVSVGILGAISVVLVGSLYTILIVRAKQQSIQSSASGSRAIFTTIVHAIEQASAVTIAGNVLQITGNPCRTIVHVGSPNFVLRQSIVPASPTCTPAGSGTDQFSPPGAIIHTFSVVKNIDKSVSITLSGSYKDAFGSHDFSYQTSVIPRTSL